MEEQREGDDLAVLFADDGFARRVRAEQAFVQQGFGGHDHVFEFFKDGQFHDHGVDVGDVVRAGRADGKWGSGHGDSMGLFRLADCTIFGAGARTAQATLARHTIMPRNSSAPGR